MIIIPSIDILENKIVRLKKGDYEKKDFYDVKPLDMAQKVKDFGFKRIHIVDLEASKNGKFKILDTLKEIKEKTGLEIEFGGGLRKAEDVNTLFDHGVDRIIAGSISVLDKPEFEKIVKKADPEKIIVAVDVKEGFIAVKGWTENSDLTISEHLEYCKKLGINHFLCTDISRDGMLEGPNFGLYDGLQSAFPWTRFIASGGVSSLDDVKKLRKMKLYAVVIGRALYENIVKLEELAELG